MNEDLNWLHQVLPVTDGSLLKSPNPKKKFGLAVTKRFKLFTEVLTARLPMSPEAANEKLAETAFAGGTIPLRIVEKENTDRVSSNITRGRPRRIRLARNFPQRDY